MNKKIKSFEDLETYFEKTEFGTCLVYKITNKISVKKVSKQKERYFIMVSDIDVEVSKEDLIKQLSINITSELFLYQDKVKENKKVLDNAMFLFNGTTFAW